MSKYNRKKENPTTATTDEFVGFWQKAFMRVRPYARAIGFSLVGFIVVFGAVTIGTRFFERRAEAATEAYGRVVRMYEGELVAEDAAKDPAKDAAKDPAKDAAKPKDPNKPEDVPKFKTAKERGEATLAELDKLPPSVAKNARLFRAGVLFDLERYEDAQKAYVAAAEAAEPGLAAVAREGAALCFEQLGKLDEAAAAFEKVAPRGDKATDFFRDRALFGAARVLEAKKDKAGAIERYKEIVAKYASSPLHDDAQNRLAVLEAL